jgi:hypothetical protein
LNFVNLPASSNRDKDEIETGSSEFHVTPRMLTFKNEGGDATDMSNSTARDTLLPTSSVPPTNLEEEL